MRKRVFLAVLLSGTMMMFPVLAEEPAPKLLGAGAVVMTSPYYGVGAKVMPVPFFSWDYKGFYFRGIEAGYSFYEHGGLKLSVVTSPRMMGYSSEDSTALNGMEDRRQSWDAGLRAELELPFKGLSLNARVLNDILSRYNGREGELFLEQFYKLKYFRLRMSAGVKAQSAQLTGYYYGVRSAEVRPDRSAYDPGSAADPFVGVMLATGFSKEWRVVIRTGVEWLDNNICKSPIVKDTYIVSGAIGVARNF